MTEIAIDTTYQLICIAICASCSLPSIYNSTCSLPYAAKITSVLDPSEHNTNVRIHVSNLALRFHSLIRLRNLLFNVFLLLL